MSPEEQVKIIDFFKLQFGERIDLESISDLLEKIPNLKDKQFVIKLLNRQTTLVELKTILNMDHIEFGFYVAAYNDGVPFSQLVQYLVDMSIEIPNLVRSRSTELDVHQLLNHEITSILEQIHTKPVYRDDQVQNKQLINTLKKTFNPEQKRRLLVRLNRINQSEKHVDLIHDPEINDIGEEFTELIGGFHKRTKRKRHNKQTKRKRCVNSTNYR